MTYRRRRVSTAVLYLPGFWRYLTGLTFKDVFGENGVWPFPSFAVCFGWPSFVASAVAEFDMISEVFDQRIRPVWVFCPLDVWRAFVFWECESEGMLGRFKSTASTRPQLHQISQVVEARVGHL